MIALYILGGLAVLTALLLFCDVTVRVDYRETFRLAVGYLFLRFQLVPEAPKKPRKKKKAAEKTAGAAPEKKSGKKMNISLGDIVKILREVLAALGRLTGKARVRPCRLWILVASGDAAQTALNYGRYCAGVAALNAVLREAVGDVRPDFRVGWDYTHEKTQIQAQITVRIRLFWIVGNAVRLLWNLFVGDDAALRGLISPERDGQDE